MAVRFCIGDVLDQLERTDRGSLDVLVEVEEGRSDCGGFAEDVFTLASRPKLLEFGEPDAALKLGTLIEEVPLYRINMELTLDEALAARHVNARLKRALEEAFTGIPLPNTLRIEKGGGDLQGTLRHPLLGHLGNVQLAEIYIGFLEALGAARGDFSFEQDIIGSQQSRFLESFDGYIQGGRGKMRAALLIGFGVRADHEAGRAHEDYFATGQREALKMRIEEPHELIWAWLEADHYQMRRCRDVHRVRTLPVLPRIPNWIRNDVLAVSRKEATKQAFAEMLAARNPGLTLLSEAPLLKKAVQENAAGVVNPLLQKLMEQTMNTETAYTGIAYEFAAEAIGRRDEAHRARLD